MKGDAHGESTNLRKGPGGTLRSPGEMGEVIASLAENLEVHMEALNFTDENTRKEYEAYLELANEHRKIANHLSATAKKMAGYSGLPMGRHDMNVMSAPKVVEAYKKFLQQEEELLGRLRKSLEQGRKDARRNERQSRHQPGSRIRSTMTRVLFSIGFYDK